MNFRESLDFLYGLQRFGIKLGLENIRNLLERLDRPDRAYGSVHVAGTNGKGSVCATLAEILSRAGVRTGLYTSPHLQSFTERIRVNGLCIPEAEVADLTARIHALSPEIPATFFEFTTAMALLHFRSRQVQMAILETGMGGRLDATNAVSPRVTVLTPISLDHTDHLGSSLSDIAAEKGGIIKPGVPVVIGEQEPEVLQVLLEIAMQRGAEAVLAGRDFSFEAQGDSFRFCGLGLNLPGLRPGLPGLHQYGNASLAVAAACLLRQQGLDLGEKEILAGVAGVFWPGRLEWWNGERQVLLDGAHNLGGARILADYLESLHPRGVHWVVGIKGDKRPDDILGPLLPRVKAIYATVPPAETTVSPEILTEKASAAGVLSSLHPSPADALQCALSKRQPGEIVLVAGSLFLVAAARDALARVAGRAA